MCTSTCDRWSGGCEWPGGGGGTRASDKGGTGGWRAERAVTSPPREAPSLGTEKNCFRGSNQLIGGPNPRASDCHHRIVRWYPRAGERASPAHPDIQAECSGRDRAARILTVLEGLVKTGSDRPLQEGANPLRRVRSEGILSLQCCGMMVTSYSSRVRQCLLQRDAWSGTAQGACSMGRSYTAGGLQAQRRTGCICGYLYSQCKATVVVSLLQTLLLALRLVGPA